MDQTRASEEREGASEGRARRWALCEALFEGEQVVDSAIAGHQVAGHQVAGHQARSK